MKKKTFSAIHIPAFLSFILKKPLLSYLVYFVVGVLLFSKSLTFKIVELDDDILLDYNFYFLKDISNIGELFMRDVALHAPHQNTDLYRPIQNVSYMLDTVFFKSPPFMMFHISNIAYHILATCLLFFLLLKINKPKTYSQKVIAFLLPLFFLVHPLQGQAVAWLPGRADVLLGIFSICAFIFLVNYSEKQSVKNILFHLLFFTTALFSKETAIVLLPLFFIYLWKSSMIFFRSGNIFIFFGWVVISLIWYQLRANALVNSSSVYVENIFSSILFNSPAILQYIGKIFLPFQLSVLPIIKDTSFIYGLITLAILTFILFSSKDSIKNNFIFIFGCLWFLFLVAPPLILRNPTLVEDPQYEHRLYVPLMGILISVSSLIKSEEKNELQMKKILSISIFYLLILSTLTFFHLDKFKDRFAFWKSAAETSPNSPMVHVFQGTTYITSKNYVLALEEFQISLKLNPSQKTAHHGIGTVYLFQQKYADAEKEFFKEMQLYPNFPWSYYNMGILHLNQSHYEKAIPYLTKFIQLYPRHAPAFEKMARCYALLQKDTEAEKAFKQSLQLEPANLDALLGMIYLSEKYNHFNQALEYAEQYLRMGGQLEDNVLNDLRKKASSN